VKVMDVAGGVMVGQTGQQITHTHSTRTCEPGPRGKPFCWYDPLGPFTFTVRVPGFDDATFVR
jgi:hypothetical protein